TDSAYTQGGSLVLDGQDAIDGIGIKVAPTGYAGTLTLQSGSTVTVTGDGSTGLAVFGPLTGSIRFEGSVVVTGEDAAGLVTTAPITGVISNSGSITAQGIASPSSKGDNPLGGWAMAIGGSVSDGIYNAGPDAANVGAAAARLSTLGDKPTLWISPGVPGAAAQDLTIGKLDDPDNIAGIDNVYSIVNRGAIGANGVDPGVNSTAILIAGDGGHTATLEGGLFNGNIISSLAHSGDKTAAPAEAVAIEIGNGGVGTKIVNQAQIAASTQGVGGGSATAILIDDGGSLGSLENGGSIKASVILSDPKNFQGSVTACAICDLSGTLTSVANAGTISATATDADGAVIETIAADLSHGAGNVTFTNKGTVVGDVLFG
ncbi:MAG: hypothetical protein ACREMY_23145, partial [bacterium]